MKKRLLFVFTILFMFMLIPNKAFADNSINYDNALPLSYLDEFNIIRNVYPSIEEDFDEIIDRINYFIGEYANEGVLHTYIRGTFNDIEYDLKEDMYFNNGLLYRITYSFDDNVFFDMDMEDEIIINIDTDFDISYYLGDYEATFKRKEFFHTYTDMKGITDYDISMIESDDYYFFFKIYGLNMKYNSVYEGKDLHVVMGLSHILTMDEIKNEIEVSDYTSENTSYMIINNTYNHINAKAGEYTFTILAYDESLNATVQKVYVNVIDDIYPIVDGTNYIETEYNIELSESDIYEYFSIYDDTEYDKTLDLGGYLTNPNIVADYNCKIIVTDSNSNTTEKEFVLSVKDRTKPKLLCAVYYNISSKEEKTELDIKEMVSVIDEYDGQVRDNIVIDDLNNYFSNPKKVGTYKFNLECPDNHGNSITGEIYLVVKDYDYPEIKINNYIILTGKGESITKEQVQELFKSLGYDISLDSLDSECFDIDSLDGEYNLDIIEEDGSILHNKVTTIEAKKEVSYDIPVKKETKKNLSISTIIIISISSGLLFLLLILGVVFYKKKH